MCDKLKPLTGQLQDQTIMPTIENENPETEEEENEPEKEETLEDENTGSEGDDDSEGSIDEDGSEMDEEECTRRRNECLDDMAELERQFSEIREQLYKERLAQIDSKLEEVRGGRAAEYLEPLQQLQEQMQIRTQVAGVLREMRINCTGYKQESETLGANQHMMSEKMLLFDAIKSELEDKIRRLEEDRNNIDISSDLWNETQILKKSKRKSDPFNTDRRKKPVTVTGPYIVYMLKDVEVIEDWTAIKKALKQQSQKRRIEYRALMMR